MRVNDTILKPRITERAIDKTKDGVYAFEVAQSVNKHQIKAAVESLYGVSVSSVRTLTRRGKTRRVGKKLKAKKLPDKKIAYIKVTKGTISIFPST
ncbi:MAG: 50S ribosomal protein L23 [Candidatus Paceibacterota bacterium]